MILYFCFLMKKQYTLSPGAFCYLEKQFEIPQKIKSSLMQACITQLRQNHSSFFLRLSINSWLPY